MKRVDTIKELCDHLQTAVEIEWSVIPPYLCALWSLHEDANELAAAILKDVLMEEMLHLTLAANVLIALGGRPRLVPPAATLPAYPGFLPHSDDAFQVSLLPFSEDAVKTFRRIEQPAAAGTPLQPDRYATIAQFYEALIDAVKTIGKDPAVWKGKGAPQVTGEYYYGGGGAAFRVDGPARAVEALELITYEGEGSPGSVTDGDQMLGEPEELAHFFRFDELLKRRQYTLNGQAGHAHRPSDPSRLCGRAGDGPEPAHRGLPDRERPARDERGVRRDLQPPAPAARRRLRRQAGANDRGGPDHEAAGDAGRRAHERPVQGRVHGRPGLRVAPAAWSDEGLRQLGQQRRRALSACVVRRRADRGKL